jgi:hypothetical protein
MLSIPEFTEKEDIEDFIARIDLAQKSIGLANDATAELATSKMPARSKATDWIKAVQGGGGILRDKYTNLGIWVPEPEIMHKGAIAATIRVPMVKKGSELEIWEYVSVPLLMEDGSYAEPIIDKKWLAIGDGLPEDVMGVTLSEDDLRRCMENENMWVCPHIKLIQRYPAKTCLGSLFFKRWEEARSRCQWKPASSKSKIIAASLGELTFFTLTPVEVAIKCDKVVTTRTITSTQDLDVGRGC